MSIPPQINFVEEIALLALDDTTGRRLPMPPLAHSYALAGAVLAELSLHNRIDTDLEKLTVLSTEPTGDSMLDDALKLIATAPAPQPVSRWLGFFSDRSLELERAADERLVARGILRREQSTFLWVFGTRKYPTIDNHERSEVRTRLTALILGDDLPDPRDAALLSLLRACRLAETIFKGKEFTARADRIERLAKMDLVGREVAASIDAVTLALYSAMPLGM